MASYRVLCTLANASFSINGVAFIATRRGMLSEIIPLEQAKAFAAIRGKRSGAGPAPDIRPEGGDGRQIRSHVG